MVLSTTAGGALVGTGGGLRTDFPIRSRKTNNAAPAAPKRSTNTTAARIEERGDDARRAPNCAAPSAEAGRGLPTWEADRMNFVSCDVGAWGTTIFWKQVGHSICPPLVLESAVMCWPHTGQTNLNSLMASPPTIPHGTPDDKPFLAVTFVSGRRTFGVSEAHEKNHTCLPERTVCRRPGGCRRAVYRIHLVRPAALAAGYCGVDGPCDDAPGSRLPDARGVVGNYQRVGCHREADQSGEVPVAGRAGGCAHEHRVGFDPAGAGGRQAAYRPVAQRPGGVGHAALAAGTDRGTARGASAAATRAYWSGRTGERSRHPGLHAFATGAAGLSGASPVGLLGDAGARRPALPGRPRAGERLPARQRRAGRLDPAAGPRASGRPARFRGRSGPSPSDAKLDGRRERPRFRGGILRQRGADRGAPVAPGRGSHSVVEQRVQLHPDRRCLYHRLIADAAEEESRRGGADPGQERPSDRQPGCAADAAEGPADDLQPRPAGRQGAAVRHGGYRARGGPARRGHAPTY